MTEHNSPRRDTIVEVPGNPSPDGAKIIWYKSTGQRNLRACFAPARDAGNVRGTAIICPGRTEFIEKYFEVARELQDRGFAILILDWPGQGLSDRLLPDRGKGHIDRFETFMGAFRDALKTLEGDLPRPHVCLAHSMGGAITLGAMAEKFVTVDAAAFSAPMWGIKQPFVGMRLLVSVMGVLGRSGDYAVKPGPPETFETNVVTHDEAHWQLNRDLLDVDPDLELGPVTWGWLRASFRIFKVFADRAKMGRLNMPVMVATAAEEKLVDNASHARIANLLPDCEHIEVQGARHEILMEKADKRAEFWVAFDRLLERAKI